MYTYINKRFGALFVFAFAVICSVFLSASVSHAVSAATGVWKDRGTITVNGVDYKGPTTTGITGGMRPVQVQLFAPASGNSIVYFSETTVLDTATSGSFNDTRTGIGSEELTLTNKRPTAMTTDSGATSESAETCAIDGVGWVICPVASFLGKVNDGAYAVAEKLLIFTVPNPFSTDPKLNAIYAIWNAMRNVANVMFVIAFFAVIFSQATSMGISAYGIRKMLPRIVVAAILVNLSYYICIFGIDVSNIIGAGFDGIIKSATAQVSSVPARSTWETVGSTVIAAQATGFALGTAALVAYFATGLFAALAVSGLLAIVITILLLLMRHALLIMLIILSPLAFVAYILPNTESLFDKWRKGFISLLVMYPLIALLFAGARVASDVILMTHQGSASTGGKVDTFYMLMALGVLTIPLFGVPWIVKFSGGALARFAGVVNNRSKGLVDRARKAGEQGAAARRRSFVADAASGKFGSRPTSGFETNPDGTLKYGADGKPIKKQGARARLQRARGLASPSGALQSAARYGGDKKWERENRIREAEKAIHDDRIERLTETANMPQLDDRGNVLRDDDGNVVYAKAPTAAANAMVARAAGVGREKGQARVRALASEQRRKELGEDIKRAIDDNLNADLYNHDIDVYEKGNRDAGPLKMHERLAAIASEHDLEWTDSAGKVHTVSGKDIVQRYAAVSRLEATGDKKAAAAMYFSDKIQNRPREEFGSDAEYNVYLEQRAKDKRFTVRDPEIRSEIERAVGASSALGEAFPEQRKSEAGAYNTVNAMLVSKFSKESTQLAYQYYDNQDIRLRANLEAAEQSGNQEQIVAARQALNGNTTARENFNKAIEDALKNPTYSGNFDPGTLVEFEKRTGKKVDSIVRGEDVTQGGLIVPHGTRAQAASAAASNPGPAPSPVTPAPVGTPTAPTPSASPAPAPSSSGPAPAPSAPEPTSREQRESGGNFGGFRYEPPQQTPSSGASQGGGSFDASGRFTPNRPDGSPMSPDEADEYHRRFGGGN